MPKLSRFKEQAQNFDLGSITFKVGNKPVSIKTFKAYKYDNGFSFQVKTELEAYQAAYAYRDSKSVRVEPSSNPDYKDWIITVNKN